MKAIFSRIWHIGLLVVVLLGFAITCLSSSGLLEHLPYCAPHLYSCAMVVILPWLLFTMCVLVPVALVSANSDAVSERSANIPKGQAVAALVACAALMLMMFPPLSFSWMRTSGLSRFLLPPLVSATMAGALIAMMALFARLGSESAAAPVCDGRGTEPSLIAGGGPTRAIAVLIAVAYAYAVSTNHYGTSPSLLSMIIVMAGVFSVFAFLLAHAPRIVAILFRRSAYPVLKSTVLAAVVVSLILIPRFFLYVGEAMNFPIYNDPKGFLFIVEGQAVFGIACLASALHRGGERASGQRRPLLMLGLFFPLWFVPAWNTFNWLDWGDIQTKKPWQWLSSVIGIITLVVFLASAIRGLILLIAGKKQARKEEANP